MPLTDRLTELVQACFTGIWVTSHEHEDALADMTTLCREHQWSLALWDVDQGLRVPGQSPSDDEPSGGDPLAAIRSFGSMSDPSQPSLLVLTNFHRFLQSAEIVQALARQISQGKQQRTFMVVLAPVVQIPIELEKLFVVVEHELPTREQLAEIARGIATEPGELPDEPKLDAVLDAATGLTRYEAESAFSLSLVREGRLTAETMWEQKSQMLAKSGLLHLYRGGDDFSTLGGLASLKAFCKRALLSSSHANPKRKARGVLLLGVPGTGKSQFCKALGSEVGRPVVTLDVGSLMGSLVGQTEERTRQALGIIDAMSPCVAMIDEVEKAFAGAQGQGDSGVAARMFGTFLSWLSDHESDVFVVLTANCASKLPPEFSRSERFDAVFFLDLPNREEKDAIWEIYITYFELDASQRRPDDTDWTGAEIRSCCRLAALLDMPLLQAAQNIVPVAVTAAESVERLRTWASGRCLSANQPGVYQRDAGNSKSRRRINRAPSNN